MRNNTSFNTLYIQLPPDYRQLLDVTRLKAQAETGVRKTNKAIIMDGLIHEALLYGVITNAEEVTGFSKRPLKMEVLINDDMQGEEPTKADKKYELKMYVKDNEEELSMA